MTTPSQPVPKGQRNQALRDTAFEMGRAGATNHQILARISVMSEQMGKYTDRNLFEKWTRLLGMVREVRRAGISPQTAEATEDGAPCRS